MRQTFVCSDAETTELVGPKPRHLRRQPHVTEFAVVTVTLDEDGEKPEAMNVLVNPTVTIPLKSVRRIGISQANVEQQPEFSHFAPTIQAILARADIRCGHNLISDGRMLDIEFGHTGQQGRAEEQGRAAVWQAHQPFRTCTNSRCMPNIPARSAPSTRCAPPLPACGRCARRATYERASAPTMPQECRRRPTRPSNAGCRSFRALAWSMRCRYGARCES